MKIGIDYIGVSAGAVIVNKEGKYFLAKRGFGARDDVGKWEFPGGAIEFYETRKQAVKRNILEKYNIEIEIDKLLGVYEVIDRENQDHWLSTTYLCHFVRGEPTIADKNKCAEIGWFSFEELKNLDVSRITQLNLDNLLK